jgi:5'-nucleotidase
VFGAAPDLVLAGINPGANVGLGVMHSGTVGAALTAARHGCPAVALSIELGGPYHWPTALAALSVVLPVVLGPAAPDRPPLVLNTNVPNIAVHELLGVVRTGLAPRSAAEFTVERVGPELLRAHHRDGPSGSEGDSGLLAAGYATVTPLGLVTEDADAAFALPPLPDTPQPGPQTAVRHPLTAGGPQ